MKTIRVVIIGLAVAQLLVWTGLLMPRDDLDAPMATTLCVTMLAAALTLNAAVNITRRAVTIAQLGQWAAFASCPAVIALGLAQHGPEGLEGVVMGSPLYALWAMPPIVILAGLHFLKRSANKSGPSQDAALKLADVRNRLKRARRSAGPQ